MIRSRSVLGLVLAGVVIAGVLGLVGCSSQGTDDSKALEGKVWKATEIAGTQGMTPAIGVEITAEFASGKLTGTGGVNRYSTTYTTQSGNKITIAAPAATLMAGPPAVMAQEQAYFAWLPKATRYVVTADSLTLEDAQSNPLVKYVAVKPATLTGTEWDAIAYNNGRGGLQSLAASSAITATFGTDGSLSGNASINEYHTKYTASAGKMTIQPQISTTRMAGSTELMDQEAAYLAALPKTATYTIDGDELWLRDSTGAAMAAYVAK